VFQLLYSTPYLRISTTIIKILIYTERHSTKQIKNQDTRGTWKRTQSVSKKINTEKIDTNTDLRI